MPDLSLRVTRGDATMLYATFVGSYTLRIHLRMDECIDEVLMRIALDKTAKRYPYFCVSVRKNEKEVYYEENTAPVALIHSSDAPVLSSPQSNGHIWAVSYWEDNLYIDFFHGRADGSGVYPLVATLLYYYLQERYGLANDKGIRTLEKPVTEQETHDPVDDLPLIDLNTLKAAPVEPALNLMEEKKLSGVPGKGIVYRLSLPEETFIPFIKENDATPGLMVCVLFARAIERVIPEHAAPIVNQYIVNARPMLHAKETFHNCTNRVVLHYDKKIRKMPLEMQGTVYRGKTFIQSDNETIRNGMTVSGSMAQMLLDLPDLQTKVQAAGQAVGGMFKAASFIVSYVGKWPYHQLESHMLEFWTYTPAGPFPLIEVSAVNGKVFLSIMQSFEDDVFYKAFTDELKEHGLEYTEHGQSSVQISDMAHCS